VIVGLLEIGVLAIFSGKVGIIVGKLRIVWHVRDCGFCYYLILTES